MKSRFASNVVCVGKGEVIGVIHQQGARGIVAVLSATGEKFGPLQVQGYCSIRIGGKTSRSEGWSMTVISHFSVPAALFTHAIQHGPEHLRPIMGAAVIVSCAPLPAAYATAATNAALFRQDILIVETRLQFEPAWKTFVESHHPGIALLLCTVEPQGGVQ